MIKSHWLTPDILGGQLTDLISDGDATAYLHLDNGVILHLSAVLVEGMPKLVVDRVVVSDLKPTPVH
jgi:hypothetical protein